MPSPNHKARSSSTSLGRLSTGDALRRGDLKISEPIPIPREGKEGLGPQTGIGVTDFQTTASLRDTQDSTSLSNPRTTPAHDAQPMDGHRGSPDQRATSYNTTSRITMGNLHDSISSAPSKDSRKTNGLRATFRKIFRRKDRACAVESMAQEPSSDVQSNQVFSPRSPTRVSSLPIQNITGSGGLNSHSPLAPFGDREDLRRLDPQDSGSLRRRNTLPSVVFSPQEEQTLRNTLGETAIRSSKIAMLQQENVPMINHPNRRSRSAGALRETAQFHRLSPNQWERPSDEDKTWRFPFEAGRLANKTSNRDADGSPSRPVTRGSNTVQPSESAAPPPPPIRNKAVQPAQSFDFGPLLLPGSDDSATIEQRVTTVEVKLIDLEYAIAKLQGYDIARPVASSRSLHNAHSERGLSSKKIEDQSQQSSPSGQFQHSATFLSSPVDSPNPPQDEETFQYSRHQRASAAPTLRPLTAFHQPSSSTLSDSSTDPRVHQMKPQALASDTYSYSHLLTLIQTEQSSRRTLELQVQKLQREVEQLRSSSSYRERDIGEPYPTPSTSSVSQEQQTPSSTQRVLTISNSSVPRSHGFPARRDSGPASGTEHSRVQPQETMDHEEQSPEFQSAFDDRSDDGTETDDDGYMDVYETPTETNEGYAYGRFGSSEGLRQHSPTQKPPNYLTMI